MFTDLAIDVDSSLNPPAFPSQRLYLSGETLLEWANAASSAARAKGTAPAQDGGTKDKAIRLAGVESWMGAWALLKGARKRHLYFNIGGRLIHKIAQGGQQDGFADGFYVADDAYSGTDSTRDGTIWARKDGASYRDFGNFMHKKNSETPMEGVVWSQRTASKLRMVLKGKTGSYAPASMQVVTDHGAANPTDTESALPLLCAAMFLAEPARNDRSWIIGLMMLDLFGAEYVAPKLEQSQLVGQQMRHGKFYTLQRALVHPSRMIDPAKYGEKNYPRDPLWQNELNEGSDKAPEKWVQDQVKREKMSRKKKDELAKKMKQHGSAAVEGLYPPSPKWSGRSKSSVDVANDYIQQKEVSILCRWLEQEFNAYIGSVVQARAVQTGGKTGRKDVMTADFGTESSMKGFKADLERIVKTELITKRANSFDTPGMLFR